MAKDFFSRKIAGRTGSSMWVWIDTWRWQNGSSNQLFLIDTWLFVYSRYLLPSEQHVNRMCFSAQKGVMYAYTYER